MWTNKGQPCCQNNHHFIYATHHIDPGINHHRKSAHRANLIVSIDFP